MIEKLSLLCDADPASVKFKVGNVEQHLAHIASSYYCSPFDKTTSGFSYDASGDFVSGMAARCEVTSLEVIDRVYLPNSLGFFYTALCQYIGFTEFGEEYKVMGLAPYGEDRYKDEMRHILDLPDEGWYKLKKEYFGMHEGGESGAIDSSGKLLMVQLYTDKLVELLGEPTRRTCVGQREKNIARSVQVRFEEAAIHCVDRLSRMVKSEQIAMAGGCSLNGVANARILRETQISDVYIQAAASDDGTCIGAAYWVWHNILGRLERFHMQHAFWGPKYSHQEIKSAVDFVADQCHVEEYSTVDKVVELAAECIASGNVIGWYQGRSEWGPRALGNRSILANPANPSMKEIINTKIKRRESFRPFAPSVLKEDVNLYFEQNVYSPFMMHVVKIKEEWRKQLPAITHVDGTGRLQTVDKASNGLYHSLISAVKKHTGIGMVLNTSFNENEPVVDTPEQAINCFLRTDMDVLCIGNYILRKINKKQVL